MSCCYNILQGVSHIAGTSPISLIEINLLSRFDYGLLSIGGWGNVTKDSINIDGVNLSRLVPMTVTGYNDNTVFQSARQNWVYETYLEYTNTDGMTVSPIEPVIYVNNVAISGEYSINYQLGQVVFDDPIVGDVRAEYSYKNYNVTTADRECWFREINFWDEEFSFFKQIPDCDSVYLVNSAHRVQLPAVIINAANRGSVKAYAIGQCKKRIKQDIHFYILTECKEDREKLINVITQQSDSGFCSFNCDIAAASGELPINCGGLTASTTFGELIAKYPWYSLITKEVQIIELETLRCGLYKAMLKMPIEIVMCC